MPAIIPALVIGGAGLAGAAISSSAAGNAAQDAASAAGQNNALESQIYQSNTKLETPYINAGDTAENALEGFLGLGGNPQATDQAFNNYLNSTGYQFALNQGLNGVAQTKAAQGLLGSGSLVKALDAYGTGLAQQYGQQYVGNLQNLTNTGEGAANALAGFGQNYAGQVSTNNNNAATAAGNAAVASAMRLEAPSTMAFRPMADTPDRRATAPLAGPPATTLSRPRSEDEMTQTVNAFAPQAPNDLSGRLAALSPDQRAAAARQAELLAAVGQGLAGRPYAERQAILAHMAPHLAARGVPPEVAAGFDPTDENLAAAVSQALSLRAKLAGGPGESPPGAPARSRE